MTLSSTTVQMIDAAMQIAGIAACIAVVARWRRKGRLGNPLRGAVVATTGPSLGAVIVVLLVFAGIAITLSNALTSGEPRDAHHQLGSRAFHLVQLADSIAKLGAAAVAWVLLHVYTVWPNRDKSTRYAAGAGMAIVAVLAMTPVVGLQLKGLEVLLHVLQPEWTPPQHPALLALQQSTWGDWGRFQLAMSAIVVAAVAEEVFFRGLVLQGFLGAIGRPWVAILLTALAFGVVHGSTQPLAVLPLTTLGAALGFLRVRTGSLWPPILMHALFNARSIAIALLAPELLHTA